MLECDEQITGKQRLSSLLLTPLNETLASALRAIAVETLALKVLFSSLVLSWFALHQIPSARTVWLVCCH
ncbi:hypothetical protein AO265_05945 [Pseudomonas sp. ABAC61]|nr:hypothetical protein AO265_05945 [Pseudomonas sp. ABAC61]